MGETGGAEKKRGTPIEIVWQDERLLVANKPGGLLSVPTPGAGGRNLVDVLTEQVGAVLAVHRLDRETSGLVLFARDEATRGRLELLFRERALRKEYWALARGSVKPAQGAWKFPILEERGQARVSARGKPSQTRYRTLASSRTATELELELVTGRYNQIRVHAAHAGFPLIGERKYARGSDDPLRAKRVALHAWRLAFAHPWSAREVRAQADLPAELVALAQRARTG